MMKIWSILHENCYILLHFYDIFHILTMIDLTVWRLFHCLNVCRLTFYLCLGLSFFFLNLTLSLPLTSSLSLSTCKILQESVYIVVEFLSSTLHSILFLLFFFFFSISDLGKGAVSGVIGFSSRVEGSSGRAEREGGPPEGVCLESRCVFFISWSWWRYRRLLRSQATTASILLYQCHFLLIYEGNIENIYFLFDLIDFYFGSSTAQNVLKFSGLSLLWFTKLPPPADSLSISWISIRIWCRLRVRAFEHIQSWGNF